MSITFRNIEQVDAWIDRMLLSTEPFTWAQRKELDEAAAWVDSAYEIAIADYQFALAELGVGGSNLHGDRSSPDRCQSHAEIFSPLEGPKVRTTSGNLPDSGGLSRFPVSTGAQGGNLEV